MPDLQYLSLPERNVVGYLKTAINLICIGGRHELNACNTKHSTRLVLTTLVDCLDDKIRIPKKLLKELIHAVEDATENLP